MLIFSVPGTGTCFALNFITKLGIPFSGLAHSRNQKTVLVQEHSDPTRIEAFEEEVCPLEEVFENVIVPLRHPYKVYRSCTRMGFPPASILGYFKCLIDHTEKFKNVFFTQVDIPKRQRKRHVQALAKFVGIADQEWIDSYTKAWKPINVWPTPYSKLPWIPELEFAVDWYKDHK